MGRYRDKLQIVADILAITSDGARKTRIMYQANLSYKLLCRYLGEVLDARLVSLNDEDSYAITPKGEEFLSRYREYSKLCERLEKQFSLVDSEKSVLEKLCLNDNDDQRRDKKGLNAK